MKWFLEIFTRVLALFTKAREEQNKLPENVVPIGGTTLEDREIIWKKSPNYGVKQGREISAVILHHTASWNTESTVDWLCDPGARVSAHYVVGFDGTIYQLVMDMHVAWHAGRSELEGRPHVNNFSVGIEIMGDTTKKPLTQEQWEATVWLTKKLMREHNIPVDRVVTHRDIAPGRKVDLDPAHFSLEDFRAEL